MEQHDYILLLEKFFKKKASAEEIRILVEWIRRPGIRDEFNLLCEQMWKDAAVEIDKTVEEDMWNHLQRNLDGAGVLSPKKARWQPVIYKVAATILLPVCLALATYLFVGNINKVSQDPFMVAVDYGQKANITLPDGTKVWLNSATHLSYDAEYNKEERKIYLDGEAYFEVAKNKEKRFVVCCNDLEIEALGTTFDVKGYSDDLSVTTLLAEGSVRVSNQTSATLLKPGEKVEYHKGNRTFTKSVIPDIREIDFWRKNMLIFNSASLADIATTLERMYGVKVVFDSEKLKNVPFSGTIRNSSLHNVFYIISLTYPLTYKLEGDTVRIGSSIN
ncbi:FecR family protein [Bacteroides sp. GM023]|uniref:FecR family protein n=1 Tax=Bacteroides sp. GM023 TaxID=2723058 RepID=UPI00168BE574|nr:FecR domain-containing protein [Bacteroides sp. GM023]MBD3591951.1 DUF4974 domain-containing protein [Bacteroides sp. GM023]